MLVQFRNLRRKDNLIFLWKELISTFNLISSPLIVISGLSSHTQYECMAVCYHPLEADNKIRSSSVCSQLICENNSMFNVYLWPLFHYYLPNPIVHEPKKPVFPKPSRSLQSENSPLNGFANTPQPQWPQTDR